MAAVLACGDDARLSHRSAGALFGICAERWGVIEISVRGTAEPRREGLKVRTRPSLPSKEVGTLDRIPITSPVQTMIDLATDLSNKYILRAVNEADQLGVILADDLRTERDAYAGVPGAKRLVALLDKDTFVLTKEELERLFLPISREVGLSLPSHWRDRQRLRGRLLLARAQTGRRDRRASLPPHPLSPSKGRPPRPGPYGRGLHPRSLHAPPDQIRTGLRQAHPRRDRRPLDLTRQSKWGCLRGAARGRRRPSA